MKKAMLAALLMLSNVVLVAGMLSLTALGANELWTARAAQSWPQAPGTLVTARVEKVSARRGDVSWCLRLGYRYEVQGEAYNGQRVTLGDAMCFDTPEAAQAELTRYPTGSALAVRYDPGAPKESVLRATRDVHPMGIVLLLMGVAGLAVGLVHLIRVKRRDWLVNGWLPKAHSLPSDRGPRWRALAYEGLLVLAVLGGAVTASWSNPFIHGIDLWGVPVKKQAALRGGSVSPNQGVGEATTQVRP